VKKSVGLSANVNKGSVRSCGLNSGLHLRYSVHGISAAAASSSSAMKREVVRAPVQSAHWQDALQTAGEGWGGLGGAGAQAACEGGAWCKCYLQTQTDTITDKTTV